MFRDAAAAGRETPRQTMATPAAQFAPPPPIVAPPPAAPQTITVRQPWLIVLALLFAILGAAGASLLGWQLRLLQGQMTNLQTAISQTGRIADASSRLSDAATQANEIANQALVDVDPALDRS